MQKKLKPLGKIRLIDVIDHPELYSGLIAGMSELPLPKTISIGNKKIIIPVDMEEFCKNMVYGQRLYMAHDEPSETAIVIRMITGYFYPIVSKSKWNEMMSMSFAKNIITCKAIEIYPVAMHLLNLIKQMAEREFKLLHREPSRLELAAGIEKLNMFRDLNALDFLRDAMHVTIDEVILTPYNECLVRFMNAKETYQYQERYFKLLSEQNEKKSKFQTT